MHIPGLPAFLLPCPFRRRDRNSQVTLEAISEERETWIYYDSSLENPLLCFFVLLVINSFSFLTLRENIEDDVREKKGERIFIWKRKRESEWAAGNIPC